MTNKFDFTVSLDAASRLRTQRAAAYRYWVGTDELIDAVTLSMVMGHHGVVFGVPGTAKSDIIGTLARSMGLEYYFTQGGAELSFDELFGPVSLNAMKQDRWDRVWQNMSQAHVVFFDELGKAPTEVINATLSAMEERKVRATGAGRDVPLHSLWSATNEYDFVYDTPAAFDRFLFRLHLHTLKQADQIAELLDTPKLRDENGKVQLNQVALTEAELLTMRHATHAMSRDVPETVKASIVEIWAKIRKEFDDAAVMTNRRILQYQRAACANALINGRSFVGVSDLIVGKWILWTDPDHENTIRSIVEEAATKGQQDLTNAQRALEVLRGMVQQVEEAWKDSETSRDEAINKHGNVLTRMDVTRQHIDRAKSRTPENIDHLKVIERELSTMTEHMSNLMDMYSLSK